MSFYKNNNNLQLKLTVLEQPIPIIPASTARSHTGPIRYLVQHGIWVRSFSF